MFILALWRKPGGQLWGCFTVSSTPLAAGLLPLPPRQIEWQCKRQHRFPQKPCCAQGDHPLSAGPPMKRCHYSCSSEQLLCPLEFALQLQLQLLSRAVPVPAGCAAAPAVLGSSACTDCTLSSYLSPERKSTSLHSVWCSAAGPGVCATAACTPFFSIVAVFMHTAGPALQTAALNVVPPAGPQASTPQLSPRSRTAIPTNIPKLGGMRPKQTSSVRLQSCTAWHLSEAHASSHNCINSHA